ncbi:LOW QUALITY PROTEIN: uncharacterized protein LOC115005045 [Cottoperca gobio]|uniref:LOW QUALITY PROTEIN: uncharacterized protein LOC115005045 n=1 Tax=Cottoperca gobio TaxID=56716 RepID=A0A6J2PB12_COTGO|nr:LOW QUALITY PROTEIN: uncharacterized protein LOC115005045 [Cottoperca gobio]
MLFLPAAALCCLCSDEQVVKPVVSVYPAASRAHLEGKSSLLCLASAMFPPLVQFSWRRRKEDGPLEELPPAEGEQLELRESGRTAGILLIHQQENSTYKYRCYVRHEGGTVEAQAEQEVPAPAASWPPEREPADLPALQQADCKITCCLSFNANVSFLSAAFIFNVHLESHCPGSRPRKQPSRLEEMSHSMDHPMSSGLLVWEEPCESCRETLLSAPNLLLT